MSAESTERAKRVALLVKKHEDLMRLGTVEFVNFLQNTYPELQSYNKDTLNRLVRKVTPIRKQDPTPERVRILQELINTYPDGSNTDLALKAQLKLKLSVKHLERFIADIRKFGRIIK